MLANRLAGLEARRRSAVLGGPVVGATLASSVSTHLVAKKKAGRTTDAWLAAAEVHLKRATAYFGAERPLGTILIADARRWSEQLLTQYPGGTARQHLNSLSDLYVGRRAKAWCHQATTPSRR